MTSGISLPLTTNRPPPPSGLTDNCRGCATETLEFLQELKSKPMLQRADPAAARTIIQKILQLAQVRVRPAHKLCSAEGACTPALLPKQAGCGSFAPGGLRWSWVNLGDVGRSQVRCRRSVVPVTAGEKAGEKAR